LIGLFVSPVLPVAGSGIVGSRADRLLKQMAEMKLLMLSNAAICKLDVLIQMFVDVFQNLKKLALR